MNRKVLIEKILNLSVHKNEGHIPSSLSILDILYVLYKNKRPSDKIILSKGHASLGLYVIMNEFNYITDEELNSFCELQSLLGGHPSTKLQHVDASTGSLGHGFPIGAGKALAKKIKKEDGIVYVIAGDGEMNEGSMWETLMFVSSKNIKNIKLIIDYNHSNDRAITLDNLENKIKSFNWNVTSIDGHDHQSIYEIMTQYVDGPHCVIANTIKGKGIRMMENNPEWHHKFPASDEIENILNEL
jgi:transketolase